MGNQVSQDICVAHRSQRICTVIPTATLKERLDKLVTILKTSVQDADKLTDEQRRAKALESTGLANWSLTDFERSYTIFEKCYTDPHTPEHIKFCTVARTIIAFVRQLGAPIPYGLDEYSLNHYLGDLEGYRAFPTHSFLKIGMANAANNCAKTIIVDCDEMRRLVAKFPDAEREFDRAAMSGYDPAMPVRLIVPPGTEITPCMQIRDGTPAPYVWDNPNAPPVFHGDVGADGTVHLAEGVPENGESAQALNVIDHLAEELNCKPANGDAKVEVIE